ncbi:bifunctional ADP-dependent NAD(P)H-hydrate dehydratase/NAD(P)H-hydrate epimerase [Vannielia litorea]|uniref:Bifunctional NAD(P)H-hydrate repair enzyme n=1 Tax=Vannielia litorea TaxID=1217970 RepID=A0A1N6FLL9_9RHOB|nr:bifunctional ADP-dependent NAD(P)H-hydrate dehydratase/NAD(P)H-hydrate epimerase [Vannielia litorea]SIN96151.1 yjeF C-terminal region, hydroxyethylthiazole kinase-related/yjeF N-terminal region [Vannielia litorea]
MELLTSAQMRGIEQDAIASGEVTGLELMERAGRGVVRAMFEEWPELAAGTFRAVVLCGPGNNGGDGFVVARLLREWGWDVEVFLYGDVEKLPPDARVNHERWGELGEVRAWEDGCDPWSCDLIVDALFGTGLTRGLSRDAGFGARLPEWDLRQEPGCPRVVAVDLPSGLCSDSGRALAGDALWADLTVTFHAAKLGHYLGRGPFVCGRVAVADIGLRAGAADRGIVQRIDGPVVTVATKVDPFGRHAHKFTHGHALVLAGGGGKGGAARMAARGALRIGAGLVTVAPSPGALQENAARLDAVMLQAVGDGAALARVLEDGRITAVCLGPGLGIERAREMVPVVLGAGRATVLDADALTGFAEAPEALFEMLHEGCVLTPHGGEFARLFPDIASRLEAPAERGPAYSKVDAAREAAARAGCVVLFKGPDTVIAGPDGACSVNAAVYDRAAPWLATAGAGDVLAGFITGLMARGFAPMQAAETAAWLHVECAREFGPGLIAEDLPEMMPRVLARLEAGEGAP